MPDPNDENPSPFPPPPPSAPPPPPAAESAPPPPPAAAAGYNPPPGAVPPASVTYGQGRLSVSDDRTFCVLSHALGIVAGFLAPLLFWLLKKEDSPAVEAHSKESLNFQLNMVGWFIASFILAIGSCGLLFFVPWIVILYAVVMSGIAAFKASEGRFFQYPLIWRLIK